MLVQYKTSLKYDNPKFSVIALTETPSLIFQRTEELLRSTNLIKLLTLKNGSLLGNNIDFIFMIGFPLMQVVLLWGVIQTFQFLTDPPSNEIKTKKLVGISILGVVILLILIQALTPSKSYDEIEKRLRYADFMKKGDAAAKAGSNKLAVNLFTKAQLLFPNSWMANFNLAVNFDANLKIKKANKYYEKVLQLKPNHFSSKFNMAKNYVELGRLSEAESLFRLAVNDNPTNPKTYLNLAQLEAKKKRFKEAEKLFIQTIDLNPDFGIAHLNYAIFLTNLKQFEKAIYHLKMAFDLGVKDALLGKLMNYYGLPNPAK